MPLDRLLTMLRNLQLRPRAAHVLVVERDDGHVFVKATYNPRGRLIALNAGGCLTHRWHAIDTPHAEEIALQLGADLRVQRLDAHGPWYVAEFEDVMRRIAAFDPKTGERIPAAIAMGALVQVSGAGRGEVKAFRGDYLVVKLDEPLGGHVNTVLAPRALVKPVLRVVAGDRAA